jgi:hypothetical protein
MKTLMKAGTILLKLTGVFVGFGYVSLKAHLTVLRITGHSTFVGDLSKFAPASKQRVPSLADNGKITATLQMNAGEAVAISVFAPSKPVVSAEGATVSAPNFDSMTGLYQVTVTSVESKIATVRIAPAPVQ